MRIRALLFMCACVVWTTCMGSSAYAEVSAVSVTASADRTYITIGERITYTIAVTFHDPVIVLSDLMYDDFSKCEVLKVLPFVQENVAAKTKKVTRSFVMTLYTVGECTIPAHVVLCKTDATADGVLELMSDPIVITVASGKMPDDGEDIREIKDIISFKNLIKKIVCILSVLSGFCVLVFLVLLMKRKKRFVAKHNVILTPYERAKKDVYDLKKNIVVEKGAIDQYVDRLSDIVRAFLGLAYGFETMDLTTGELDGVCNQYEVVDAVKGRMMNFLKLCDLIKFAKQTLESQKLDMLFAEGDNILDLIHAKTVHGEKQPEEGIPS